jgi:molybdopterin synthase catalytic subunit
MEKQPNIDIQILDKSLELDACYHFVTSPACGGIDLFVGTVRNATQGKEVIALEFESYAPMAIAEMTKIAHTIIDKWQAERVSIHHRIGRLTIGDIAVIIAVSAPHRAATFAACQYAIDTLKETVPIWKKEIFKDGEVWVAAHP